MTKITRGRPLDYGNFLREVSVLDEVDSRIAETGFENIAYVHAIRKFNGKRTIIVIHHGIIARVIPSGVKIVCRRNFLYKSPLIVDPLESGAFIPLPP